MPDENDEMEAKLVDLGNHLRIGTGKRLERLRDDKTWEVIEALVKDKVAKDSEARENKLREEGEASNSRRPPETDQE